MQEAVVRVNHIEAFVLEVWVGVQLVEVGENHFKGVLGNSLLDGSLQVVFILPLGDIASCDGLKHVQFHEFLSHKPGEASSTGAKLQQIEFFSRSLKLLDDVLEHSLVPCLYGLKDLAAGSDWVQDARCIARFNLGLLREQASACIVLGVNDAVVPVAVVRLVVSFRCVFGLYRIFVCVLHT